MSGKHVFEMQELHKKYGALYDLRFYDNYAVSLIMDPRRCHTACPQRVNLRIRPGLP